MSSPQITRFPMQQFRALVFAFAFLALCSGGRAVTAELTIKVIETRGQGIEFVLAHTNGPEFGTGVLKKIGERKWRWDIGDPESDVYFYWNYFHGTADVSLQIDGVIVFSGRCTANRNKEGRLSDTCKRPKVYRRTGIPSIREPREEPLSILNLTPEK